MLKAHKGLIFSVLILAVACRKDPISIPNNQPADYSDVSTVKLENYVNRIYIDLLGREPLDAEMNRDVNYLRSGNLQYDVRRNLVTRLMTDSNYVQGDSSYKKAYYHRLYELTKARLLEGAGDEEFNQRIGNANFALKSARLTGDSIGVFAAMSVIDRCTRVLKSDFAYRSGKITLGQMYAAMLDNPIYDIINMNSLNFVNASYDDLFFRFPTLDEFAIAYDIIENGKGGILFGGFADNKPDYCSLLTESREYHEGMIKWAYLTLIGREPNTQEVHNLMADFYQTDDFQTVQTQILITDEYAHF